MRKRCGSTALTASGSAALATSIAPLQERNEIHAPKAAFPVKNTQGGVKPPHSKHGRPALQGRETKRDSSPHHPSGRCGVRNDGGGRGMTCTGRSACATRPRPGGEAELKVAEKLVELVGRIERGFELAGRESVAEIEEVPGEKIEDGSDDFAIREENIAPGGVWAACEAE